MTAESEPPSAGFPEESALLRVFGDFVDPVPMVQFVGPAAYERHKYVESLLSRNKVPFGVVESAVYAECQNGTPSALMHWMWTRFVRRLVVGFCALYPKEAPRYGKLRQTEVRTCADFVRIINTFTLCPGEPVPDKDELCMAVVVQDYHELLAHEPTLLNTLMRLHEKLHRVPIEKGYRRNKVTVIMMGPYPLPPEVTRGDFCIPLVPVELITPEGAEDLIRSSSHNFALEKARTMLPDYSEATISFLWSGFVHYFVDVVYAWYKFDTSSMEFYSRLLWSNFLEPLCGATEPTGDELPERLQFLCKSVDEHLRSSTVYTRSRFITELHDLRVSNMRLLRKQLYKFHGSRLTKYLLLGAVISAFNTPETMRRRLRNKNVRTNLHDVALWRRQRKFDLWSWIANTEWALASNESESINMDPGFFTELMWLITEGYVKPQCTPETWCRLPQSHSVPLWRVSDMMPSADLQWLHTICYNEDTEIDQCLGQMVNTTARFSLSVTKGLVISIINDLNVDIDEFLI
ncbi:hypothetical protein, conserved [Babesia bigemina]|uniref:Uncharacterized protein n=1 Tax=Babesia bigemina TaxID=5866 RepID=A0A061D7K0_BABBI|nr:hypothetical protein, conserved [Babesia bigemina]CDR93700.1 hypothetical protein, conserved [Babesia bigemina]|eukprot:XP_012765886.1 hypothetical protein, conserved [Babesia bigemina]